MFAKMRRSLFLTAGVAAALLVGAGSALLGLCGPFTDVAADAFCPFVVEVFYLGITTGTTPTTYDPSSPVSRLQMAAFLSRTVDTVVRRGSRRTALGRLWNPQNSSLMGMTSSACSDGANFWIVLRDADKLARF